MNVYVIAFDITTKVGTPASIAKVRAAVDSLIMRFPFQEQVTESCWCVASFKTAVQIRDAFVAVMRAEYDRVFVLQSAGNAAWRNVLGDSAALTTLIEA